MRRPSCVERSSLTGGRSTVDQVSTNTPASSRINGEGGGSRVEAYRGDGFGLLQSFDLLPGFTGGVFVG